MAACGNHGSLRAQPWRSAPHTLRDLRLYNEGQHAGHPALHKAPGPSSARRHLPDICRHHLPDVTCQTPSAGAISRRHPYHHWQPWYALPMLPMLSVAVQQARRMHWSCCGFRLATLCRRACRSGSTIMASQQSGQQNDQFAAPVARTERAGGSTSASSILQYVFPGP